MSLKNFFQIIILSFYSSSFYNEIGNKWRHWGLNYLLKFSIFTTAVSTILLTIMVIAFDFNNPAIIELFNRIPELRIEKNIAHFIDDDMKSPVRISLPNSKEFIIVDLDLSDANKYDQNVVVFTSDRLAFNLEGSNSFDILYSDLLEGTNINIINTDSLVKLLNNSKKRILGVLLFLGVPLGSLIFFAITLFKSLFYSSVTAVLMKVLDKEKLDLKKLTRLAIISQTPAVVISVIISLLYIQFGLNATVQSAISYIGLFYFVFAVLSCNRLSKH